MRVVCQQTRPPASWCTSLLKVLHWLQVGAPRTWSPGDVQIQFITLGRSPPFWRSLSSADAPQLTVPMSRTKLVKRIGLYLLCCCTKLWGPAHIRLYDSSFKKQLKAHFSPLYTYTTLNIFYYCILPVVLHFVLVPSNLLLEIIKAEHDLNRPIDIKVCENSCLFAFRLSFFHHETV